MNLAQRILLIGPSNVGDGILASPVVERLRAAYPAAHLTLVVGDRAAAVFAEDPRVQALVNTDLYDSALGRCQLTLMFLRYRPHVVVDLRHTFYPLLLKPWAAWRYLRQPPKSVEHMRDRHLWKLAMQAPRTRKAAPGPEPLRFTARDVQHAETLWKRWGFDGGTPVVVMVPGARCHTKRWPAERFAEVADRLIRDAGVRVILSGEPEEKPVIEEVQRGMRERAHTSIGLTTIRQLGLLMRRARLVITNDSAALHLASTVGTPTVAVFGPTDERKYGPFAQRRQVMRRNLLCTPCEVSLCRFNHECMRFIQPDEVLRAAFSLLDHAPAAA